MPRKPVNVKNLARDAQALELRKAGASYDQIARQLGYAQKSGAHHAVKRALNAVLAQRDQSALEMRELIQARLDTMLLGIWQPATRGDVQAINAVLRIEERRASMIGLDAPKRNEISGVDGAPIQVEQDVNLTLSTEQRIERIRYLIESQRSEPARSLPSGQPDLDAAEGSTNGRVA